MAGSEKQRGREFHLIYQPNGSVNNLYFNIKSEYYKL